MINICWRIISFDFHLVQRWGHPAQQQGRRIPSSSFESAFSIRIFLVSTFLPLVTQQIHSFRASGVMLSHVALAPRRDAIASRKSNGSLWTIPRAIFLADVRLHYFPTGGEGGIRTLEGITPLTS